MSIDKSWVHITNRLSNEYWNGLNDFVEYARNYSNAEGLISCPCTKCRNGQLHSANNLHLHLYRWGFDRTYTTWVFHGETGSLYDCDPTVTESIDEMVAVLDDIGNISEMLDNCDTYVDDDDDDPIENEFEDLLSELQVQLYPGCTKYSSLNFLVKLMHLKVLHKWTNESMTALLKLLKDALPDDNKLPISHYDSKKLLRKLGLGYQIIHACQNDCVLFWKETSDLQACPTCETSRLKKLKGKKVPWKVLRYFPLKDRLK